MVRCRCCLVNVRLLFLLRWCRVCGWLWVDSRFISVVNVCGG